MIKKIFKPVFLSADPSQPNVCVTRMTLLCDQAPGNLSMDLTGA